MRIEVSTSFCLVKSAAYLLVLFFISLNSTSRSFKRIRHTYCLQKSRDLQILYKHTARCVNTVRMSANCVRALPQNQQNSARMRTIVTAALQRQYSQTDLISCITLVVEDLQIISRLIDCLLVYWHWNFSNYMFNLYYWCVYICWVCFFPLFYTYLFSW